MEAINSIVLFVQENWEPLIYLIGFCILLLSPKIFGKHFDNVMNLLCKFSKTLIFWGLGLMVITAIGTIFGISQSVFDSALSSSIGLLSIGLGSLAYKLGEDSDEKMVAITNEFYIELIELFLKISENFKVDLKNDTIEKYHQRNDFHYLLINIKKIGELIKWAKKDISKGIDRKQAIWFLLDSIFNELNKAYNNKLLNENDIFWIKNIGEVIIKYNIVEKKYIEKWLKPFHK